MHIVLFDRPIHGGGGDDCLACAGSARTKYMMHGRRSVARKPQVKDGLDDWVLLRKEGAPSWEAEALRLGREPQLLLGHEDLPFLLRF